MKLSSYFILFLLEIILSNEDKDCYQWGTYKPHLLFHYMNKQGQHMGLMYQTAYREIKHKFDPKHVFSTYKVHDFEGTIHSVIRDKEADAEMDIKVLNDCEGYWEQQIEVNKGFSYDQDQQFLSLVLYFYDTHDSMIDIKQVTQNEVHIYLYGTKKFIRVSVDGDVSSYTQRKMLYKQKSYEDLHKLWQTHDIYQYLKKQHDQQINLRVLFQFENYLSQAIYNKIKNHKMTTDQQDQQENLQTTKKSLKHSQKEKLRDQFQQRLYQILKTSLQKFKKLKYSSKNRGQKSNIGFIQFILPNGRNKIKIEYGYKKNKFDFDKLFEEKYKKFQQKVEKLFLPSDYSHIHQKLYNQLDRNLNPPDHKLFNLSQSFRECLSETFSNVLGGILFYKGKIIRQDYKEDEEKFVFSASPSRSRFPRAFLWDDGFHLLPICRWDIVLCRQIIKNWMSLQDQDGWIAREQARGEEIQRDIPYEFISQDPLEANPPTLLLPIRYVLKLILKIRDEYLFLNELLKMDLDKTQKEKYKIEQESFLAQFNENIQFLTDIIPNLQQWRKWFTTTQGHSNQEDNYIKYQWRCKESCNSGQYYGSGMDDYPRTSEGVHLQEHIDLKTWTIFFDESLTQIYKILHDFSINQKDKNLFLKTFQYHKKDFFEGMDDLHNYFIDHEDNLFKDYGHSEFKYLIPDSEEYIIQQENNFEENQDELSEYENIRIRVFINHPGYVNLYPLFFGFIKPESQQLQSLLHFIKNKNHIWTDYGLRSLSKQSEFYGTDDDYWRGSIWMPQNYLTLRGLKLYYNDTYSNTVYKHLRHNIIMNVYKNWLETGYMWENFNGDTGKGQRGYPFNGWTGSVFLSICGEIYD